MICRLFEIEAQEFNWGISPGRWGFDVITQNDNDYIKLEEMRIDAEGQGLWWASTLFYFNTMEERTYFMLRWI